MGQRKVRIGVAALAALSAESWILPAGAADYSISGGNTYTDTETLAGTDRLSIEPGGKLSVNKKAAINWNDASSDLKIFNAGTIESTKAGGRAIDATGSDNTRTLTLENKTNARIKSDSDAFRINVNPNRHGDARQEQRLERHAHHRRKSGSGGGRRRHRAGR